MTSPALARCCFWLMVLGGAVQGTGAELRVPAFTAYLEPDVEGAHVSRSGIAGWKDPELRVLWFGEFKQPGKLDCSVVLRSATEAPYQLRLTLSGQSREISGTAFGTNTTVDFGSFEIPGPGYQKIVLESARRIAPAHAYMAARNSDRSPCDRRDQ